MTPDEYCQQKAAASGSSFYYSFLFLPPERRRAITALYAYCREVDDVVDECTDPGVARTKLVWWREEVGRLYADKPQHPVTQALVCAINTYGIQQQHMLELIDGMAMDLEYNRYPDFDTLKLYCHRVAGVVGLMSASIFGYTDKQTLDYAPELGLAFQLTNIIRDVGEDARRNRIYLPLDELERFGVAEGDIQAARETENFQKLMGFQIDRALTHYEGAFAKLPAADRKPQIPGVIMAAIYRTLLEEIRDDGCHVLKQRTSLTPVRKLWIASKTWFKG
ncbi:MAG: presqualene diphosphate synthase HpnD [Betaproteobacteria bacterium]|nr:presqualene diphosphate synthase HpnD [Betaproteobacteria bacterium]